MSNFDQAAWPQQPPPYPAPPSPQPPAKTSWFKRHKKATVIGGCVFGGAVILVTIASIVATPSTGGTSSAGGPSNTLVQQDIMGDLHRSGPDGFDVPQAKMVDCIMPKAWTAGTTFVCYVYGAGNGSAAPELGQIKATVMPSQPGSGWNANYLWLPGTF